MNLVVDTDPGVDDSLALLYLSSVEEVEIEAITVVAGNSNQESCLRNAKFIADLGGIEAPVYRGSEKPLERELETANSHGEKGLGDLKITQEYSQSEGDAVEALIDNADKNKRLLTLGPLTNVAKAVRKDKKVLSRYESVTCMGGAVETYGNVNRVSEFNFWVDPEAAGKVLENAPENFRLVPINACRKVTVSLNEINRIFDEPLTRRILNPYIQYYENQTVYDGAVMYDPLAAAISVNPEMAGYEEISPVVETKGEQTRGMLITERRPHRDSGNYLEYADKLNENAVEEIKNRLSNLSLKSVCQ